MSDFDNAMALEARERDKRLFGPWRQKIEALEAELVQVGAVAERRLALVDEWKLRAVKAEADLDTALRHLEAMLAAWDCCAKCSGIEAHGVRAFLLSTGSNP